MGGSGKAEGFADGGRAKPSASWRLPLPPASIATCLSFTREEALETSNLTLRTFFTP